MLRAHLGEQARNDGVLADVFGDVFFGVVRPHLFLVDEFFEDVAEHVGVDFLAARQRSVVKVPIPLAEKGKEFFKCRISDIQRLAVFLLQFVLREQSAVQVRHVAEFSADGSTVGICTLFGKTSKKQRVKKVPVETGLALGCNVSVEPLLQVLLVAIQKILLLQKPQEHQAIDQDCGIPAQVFARVGNTGDEFRKFLALRVELCVKLFGDLVAVKPNRQFLCNTEYRQ